MGARLPRAFLEAAVPGYLTEAKKQATALADRAAAHVALDNPDGVFLRRLRVAGARHHIIARSGRHR
jgi:hypothetical protein